MGCKICGRGNCISTFHSIEEQQVYDSVEDNILDRFMEQLENRVRRIDGFEDENGDYYIKYDDVISAINQ